MISGVYLRELREKIGLTQTELAEKVGITQAHIAKIENNKVDARLSTINKILSVLEAGKNNLRCKDIMVKKVIYVSPNDTIKKVAKLMKLYSISQLPVLKNNVSIGSINETTIIGSWNNPNSPVKNLMEKSLPLVDADETIDTVKSFLQTFSSILISEKGKVVGIITKSDLFKLMK
ncbi:MAG: CBS domain-containing protein [Candidatus Aenigmarchaeota archaeon]|nr:CBS domain-containing protein [Candidatus Aenigmarchaeota archaeon]